MGTYNGKKRGAKPKYPWDAWFKHLATGKAKNIRYDSIDCTPYSMITLLRGQALKRNVRISINQLDSFLRVQHAKAE